MEQIRISAKNLGAMELDDFCPRCYYIKLHAKKLPWQIFAGIFSSIDSYTKKVAHFWIERKVEGKDCPQFIKDLDVTGYAKTPHWSKFNTVISKYGIKLTGAADDFWILNSGGLHIPDFKTARWTPNQDKLISMYKIQLNGYAYITKWSQGGYPDVESLSMIYMEPQTTEGDAEVLTHAGAFDMRFNPKYVPVAIDLESLDPLFEKTRNIYDGPIPKDDGKCKDCIALNDVNEISWSPMD